MKFQVVNSDNLDYLKTCERVKCIFADPRDNIGLGYDECNDKLPDSEYVELLFQWVEASIQKADITWFSFNAKWTSEMGNIAVYMKSKYGVEVKPCVQVFTFGQHRDSDLGNNHRPIWRFMHKGAAIYPDNIRVPSWRQRNGDKRASPKGRVPGDVLDFQYADYVSGIDQRIATDLSVWNHHASGPYIDIARATPLIRQLAGELAQAPGDVFDFPRVTGNSKQRCDWHPTQLHEDMMARVLKLSTTMGDTVLDIFGGTGTTLRVCQKIGRNCTLVEMDRGYCEKIAAANLLNQHGENLWMKVT